MKKLSFAGQHLSFIQKGTDTFWVKGDTFFCIFYLHEKELKQQACLTKHVENEISNSTSHKNKNKREKERNKNIIQLQKHF